MNRSGKDGKGEPVYLARNLADQAEVNKTIAACLSPEMFRKQYANVENGNDEVERDSGQRRRAVRLG